MLNPEQRQLWLHEDKISFKIIEDQVNFIKNHYLPDIDQSIASKLNNSNGINDKNIEFTSIFETINNAKLLLNSMITTLQPLKKRINKNLKSKKINSFKNFIIRFFTFGKINRNKDIKSEIAKFKADCQDIKNKSEDIFEKLNDKTNKLLLKIGERHNLLEKEKNELIQVKTKLETTIENNKEKIKQLESNIRENKSKIGELDQENQIMHEFISTENTKFIGNYTTLKNIIKSQKQEIEILKQNEELKKKIKITDSGNESDSDKDNFNNNKINQVLVSNKESEKKIKSKNTNDSGNESGSDTNNFNKNKINQIPVSNKKNTPTRIWKLFN